MREMAGSGVQQRHKHALIVVGVALALQLGYLAAAQHDPTFGLPLVDAGRYHADAAQFAAGGELTTGAFFQPPLFPVALGYAYRLFGVSIFAAKLILAALGIASCVLIWSIGRVLFDASVGLLAGLILAAYGPFLFYSTQLLPTGPAIFLSLAALRLLLAASQRSQWWYWCLFGLLTGLATLAVPNTSALLGAAVFAVLATLPYGRRLRGGAVALSLALSGVAIPIGAVAAYNYAKSGEWVLVGNNGGINFYIGNNSDTARTINIRPGAEWYQHYRSAYAAGARTATAQNRYFYAKTWDYIRSEPGAFMNGLWQKAGRLLSAREIPRSVDVYVYRDFSALLSVLVWRVGPFAMPFGLLAPLALVGVVVGGRAARATSHPQSLRWVPPAYVGLYALSVILFFVSGRHRLPLVAVLTIYAAAGAVWCWRTARRRERTPTSARACLVALVVFVVAALAFNRPIRVPTDSFDFRAELYHTVGMALARQGAQDEGIRFVEAALALNDHYAAGFAGLGVIRAQQGDFVRAATLFRRTVELDPLAAEAHWLLGHTLCKQGRREEGRQSIERSLAIDPHSPRAHAVLADLLLDGGDLDGAITHYRTALELPDHADEIRFALADALARNGSSAEAVACYREAFEEVGGTPAAAHHFAWLLHAISNPGEDDCRLAILLAETDHRRATAIPSPFALETRAIAYAACGRFEDARLALVQAFRAAEVSGSRVQVQVLRATAGKLGIALPPEKE